MRFAWLLLGLGLAGCQQPETPVEQTVTGGNAERGRRIAIQIGCGVCHTIPGIAGARGSVGPSLAGFGRRSFIAGRVPNRPGPLVQFVRDAPSLAPETAMPELPLDERAARDVAAYLYTLR